jgi:WD40 repeat protein
MLAKAYNQKLLYIFAVLFLVSCTGGTPVSILSPTVNIIQKTNTPTQKIFVTEELLPSSRMTSSTAPRLTPSVPPAITPTSTPPLEGHFIFFSEGNLYITDAACTGEDAKCDADWLKLTNIPNRVVQFALSFSFCGDQLTASPDGKYVAFTYRPPDQDNHTCEGGWDIYTINIEECLALVDGCGQDKFVRLTDDPADDMSPDWSPDGKTIAFISSRSPHPFSRHLYTMKIDGSDQPRLIRDDNCIGQAYNPDWSPDGKNILFTVNIFPPDDYHPGSVICSANADGSNIKQLTTLPQNEQVNKLDLHPQWSPDGKQIAFDSNRESDSDIFVMNSDGSEMTRLTTSYNYQCPSNPVWSPDGERIAFLDSSPTGDSLFMINKDGRQRDALMYMVDIDSFIWIP